MKIFIGLVSVLASLLLATSGRAEDRNPSYKCIAAHAGGFRYSEEAGFDSDAVKFRVPFEWRMVPLDEAVGALDEEQRPFLYNKILFELTADRLSLDAWAEGHMGMDQLTVLLKESTFAGYLLRKTDRPSDRWYSYEPCTSGDSRVACSARIGATFVLDADTNLFTAAEAPIPYSYGGDIFVAHGRCTPFYD